MQIFIALIDGRRLDNIPFLLNLIANYLAYIKATCP